MQTSNWIAEPSAVVAGRLLDALSRRDGGLLERQLEIAAYPLNGRVPATARELEAWDALQGVTSWLSSLAPRLDRLDQAELDAPKTVLKALLG
jgi:hypothetical protein